MKNQTFSFTGFIQLYSQWKQSAARNKNAAQSLTNGFDTCLRGIDGLERTVNYLNDDVILLFGKDIPQKLEHNAQALNYLSHSNHTLYSCHVASVGTISKRYKILQSLLVRMLNSDIKNALRKAEAKKEIYTQLQELRRDLLILAQTEMQLLEMIENKFLLPQFPVLRSMKNRFIAISEKHFRQRTAFVQNA